MGTFLKWGCINSKQSKMAAINQDRILYLITGHNAVRLTYAEQRELEHWLAQDEDNRILFDGLTNPSYIEEQLIKQDPLQTEAALLRVKNRVAHLSKRQSKLRYYMVAILFSALAALSIYLFTYRHDQREIVSGKGVHELAATISVGGDRATLTLSDGKQVDLSDAGNGNIATQAGLSINKTSNGQLVYEHVTQAGLSKDSAPLYNSITIPRGGQFQVRLPDGTKVWLNAASSLRYQTDMSKSPKRIVELSGEAYFEVAHNKSKPFIVTTTSQATEVLGTHFNVNSYADDGKTVTTLAEGSVRVSNRKGRQVIIKPGEQAVMSHESLSVGEADVALATAWKNGYLQFRDVPIKEVMQMVSRWYDIDLRCEGNMPEELFNGKIDRSSNLSQLLKVLEASNIHFAIAIEKDGRKTLIVKH